MVLQGCRLTRWDALRPRWAPRAVEGDSGEAGFEGCWDKMSRPSTKPIVVSRDMWALKEVGSLGWVGWPARNARELERRFSTLPVSSAGSAESWQARVRSETAATAV